MKTSSKYLMPNSEIDEEELKHDVPQNSLSIPVLRNENMVENFPLVN